MINTGNIPLPDTCGWDSLITGTRDDSFNGTVDYMRFSRLFVSAIFAATYAEKHHRALFPSPDVAQSSSCHSANSTAHSKRSPTKKSYKMGANFTCGRVGLALAPLRMVKPTSRLGPSHDYRGKKRSNTAREHQSIASNISTSVV